MRLTENRSQAFVLSTVAGLLLCACTDENQFLANNSEQDISAFRIEVVSTWATEREAFALNHDGSGFYERFSVDIDNGDTPSKIIKRIEFGSGGVDFQNATEQIGGLQSYFGDDLSRADFAHHEKHPNLKKSIPCRPVVTDNGGIVIYWNNLTGREIGNSDRDSGFFVMDAGCRSKEASAVIDQIKTTISLFDEAVPVAERR